MKNAYAAASIALLALPLCAAAQTSVPTLEDEIDAWESMQNQNAAEGDAMQREIEFQSAAELFPEIGEKDGEGELERQRDERVSAFVSVTVDGRLIVFSDVPRDSWYAPYVREIAERGIVSGYRDTAGNPTGKFGPADNVTIEQMAKVMLLASGKTEQGCSEQPLNPDAAGTWSAPFISCAEDLEWSVYGDGTVDVHRNATRAEVVTTLLQAYGVEPGPRTGTGFTDVTLSTQYGAGIEQAKRDGIVSGYSDAGGQPTGLFGPEAPVTRAEFAKIVTLGLQIYAER